MKLSGQTRLKQKIAGRYARALWMLASGQKIVEETHESLLYIREAINAAPELRMILENPEMPHKKRGTLLKKIFETRVPALVEHLIFLLHEKDRLNILEETCEQFHRVYLREHKIIEAEVISAAKLDTDQIGKIAAGLKKRLNREIRPKALTDPELIGGFRVRVNDEVYDYSVKSQLERFRQQLLNS